MKTGASITRKQLNGAAAAVQGELGRLGLWNEDGRLHHTDVVWCAVPQFIASDASGFFLHERFPFSELLGYEPGNIYIPKWILAQGFWAQRRGSLRDLVRHEYGHAVAFQYPSLVLRSTRFTTAFGGTYFRGKPVKGNVRDFVSAYARTQPCEDFAETFMHYVRCQGTLPKELNLPSHFGFDPIKRKWQFIAEMIKVIESGGTKW